jgi:hypothetical protein
MSKMVIGDNNQVGGEIIADLTPYVPTRIAVTQNNTFTENRPVYRSGGVWALAKADAVATMGWGIVTNVTTTTFNVVLSGDITSAAHGLGTTDQWLYVSESNAGVFTATPPTIYSNPLIHIIDANNFVVMPYLASKITPDTPNPIPITVRSTDPATPLSGIFNIYSKTKANKPLLHIQDSNNLISAIQRSFWNKQITIVSPNHSTTLTGIGTWYTLSGASDCVVSHPTPTYGLGLMSNFASLATAGKVAGLYDYYYQYCLSTGFFYIGSLYFPDSSYGTGATGFRFCNGMALGAVSASDNPATQRAAFMYSTNANDPAIMFSVRNAGGTESRVSTTMAFTVQHQYRFFIFAPPGATKIYWRVEDITAATAVENDSGVAALPDLTSMMHWTMEITTLDAVARNLMMEINYTEKL